MVCVCVFVFGAETQYALIVCACKGDSQDVHAFGRACLVAGETNCANWIADCVKEGMYGLGYEPDIVLLNAGTLRADGTRNLVPLCALNLTRS